MSTAGIDWMKVGILARTGEDLDLELYLGAPSEAREKEIHEELEYIAMRIKKELEKEHHDTQ